MPFGEARLKTTWESTARAGGARPHLGRLQRAALLAGTGRIPWKRSILYKRPGRYCVNTVGGMLRGYLQLLLAGVDGMEWKGSP
jgi:hypothetical protein